MMKQIVVMINIWVISKQNLSGSWQNKYGYPPFQHYKIKNISINSSIMQGSVKHLHFLTKVTGILADTFGDIHKMLQEEFKHSLPTNNHHQPLSSSERALDDQPLSISNSENNQDNEIADEVDIDPENQLFSARPRKPHPKELNMNKQKKIEKKKKTAKWQAEGKPRPPLNAFMLFLKASKSEIMQARPQLTPAEVSTYASSLWGELPNDEKQKYRNQYKQNRSKYQQMMDDYHSKAIKDQQSPIGRKKRHQKSHLKTQKNQGGQEIVNIESDQDNSRQI